MTEAFWLGGLSTSPVMDASPQAGLTGILRELCKVTRFPVSAVGQVIWFSALDNVDTLMPGLKTSGLEQACGLCLPPLPELIHQQLQAASQAILAGDQHSIVLGIATQALISAVLLCSPETAGKLNLLPQARIAGRYLAQPSIFNPEILVRTAQEETEEEFKKVYWCGNGSLQFTFPAYFEKTEDYLDPLSGAISLARVLKTQPGSLGLLITASSGAMQSTAIQSI